MIDTERLRAAYHQVRDELLAERTPDGHWVGELSSSALATATAVSALSLVRRNLAGNLSTQYSVLSTDNVEPSETIDLLVDRGIAWLIRQQNSDGGFGDTDLSHSNIATTYLVIAALHLASVSDQYAEMIQKANAYIDGKGRLQGLRDRYGIDKTFVVPIMTNLALAGLVDWHEIDPLPFELACVPQSWYRFVGIPVVSYAIPALVAIGQARFFHAPPRNPLTRVVRQLSISRSLKVLRRMQPDSGGYLEATPLTSFVVMSLASVSKPRPAVAEQVIAEGVKFLVNSVRPDGSWPIDTNLATWNTTLAINALAGAGEDVAALLGPQCLDWLLSCQHTQRHPFTGADPGGFGWSDLSGAVPDADDTPGALMALDELTEIIDEDVEALQSLVRRCLVSLRWLVSLQNADRGWPTFCRGWGKLPFDRSGADLSAHSVRALARWRLNALNRGLRAFTYERAITDGRDYLSQVQRSDGSWSPLWFGNQDHPSEENPVYGTAKVLMAYRDLGLMDSPEAQRGVAWLIANQNEDGGWGSGVWRKATNESSTSLGEPVLSTQYSVLSTSSTEPRHEQIPNLKSQIPNSQSAIRNLQSSVEETALAVEALLAACLPTPDSRLPTPCQSAVCRGLAWLLDRVENSQHGQPAPIGFYFAKLWYYERLYPLIFTVAALGRACRQFAPPAKTAATPEPSETRTA